MARAADRGAGTTGATTADASDDGDTTTSLPTPAGGQAPDAASPIRSTRRRTGKQPGAGVPDAENAGSRGEAAKQQRDPAGSTEDAQVLASAGVNDILRQHASDFTTRALAAMEQQLPWFGALGADQRSWISVVSRTGIDGLVEYVDQRVRGSRAEFDVASVFRAAPSELTGEVSLHQTVEMMRIMIEVVEQDAERLVPPAARTQTQVVILGYSRELAFAAAEIYARAAETRGAWDARLEALVVDSIVRAEEAETVMSRASAFGWDRTHPVSVVVGSAGAHGGSPAALTDLRRAATRRGLACLVATQGDRIVAVIGSNELVDGPAAVSLAKELADRFAEGHVVVGPVVSSLGEASSSARAAISGLRAAAAWPEGERVVSAGDLLPERALAGDGHARRALVRDIYRPLVEAGGDLLETCVAFLDHGFSVEATARALFVHANTVRYRLKRVLDVTGYSPTDARDAYVLRLAVTLGRLTGPERATA